MSTSTSNDDHLWLEISPKLIQISDRAAKLKTVQELDDCIAEYRCLLNGLDDRHGTLNVIFEFRNSIVELSQAKNL